jgi:hypothetical protein
MGLESYAETDQDVERNPCLSSYGDGVLIPVPGKKKGEDHNDLPLFVSKFTDLKTIPMQFEKPSLYP